MLQSLIIKRSHTLGYSKQLLLNKLSLVAKFCTQNDEFEYIWNQLVQQGKESVYTAQMLDSWIKNSQSVHTSWDTYFSFLLKQAPKQFSDTLTQFRKSSYQEQIFQEIRDTMKVFSLIQAYINRGHEIASLDPLKLKKSEVQSGVKIADSQPELEFRYFGFNETDLDRQFILRTDLTPGFLKTKDIWTLREVYHNLRHYYTNEIAYEFAHINSFEEQQWLRNKIAENQDIPRTKEQKLRTFKILSDSEVFTDFCQNKFSTTKRFGIEGLDSSISGLDTLAYKSVMDYGIQNIAIGMPHRGRLNTLAIVFNKPLEEILAEFQDNIKEIDDKEVWGLTGDVKYHLGTWRIKEYPNGNKLRLSILANPSHLEAVNPVVVGFTKAYQNILMDDYQDKCMAVLIHGDAAFSGQGVVQETLQFTELKEYTTGGVIHIIFNNQIGFTTVPIQARSSLCCTDILKTIDSPVVHVNAENPELVDKAMELALEYRMKFKKDISINIIGYRKYGHNELDQPSFTQPLMYSLINKKQSIYILYAQKLLQEGVISQIEIDQIWQNYSQILEAAYQQSRQLKIDYQKWKSFSWTDIQLKQGEKNYQGVRLDLLRQIGQQITQLPEDFSVHEQVIQIYSKRRSDIESGINIDFSTAEALAWSSLLLDGYKVRLSGSDAEIGIFNQRHAVLYDQKNQNKYIPIRNILQHELKTNFTIQNSHLSEYGVLGYEYGYTIPDPNSLVIWEAQYGDFANRAQIIIDNFIVSGESKWGIPSAITLLLPHGFDDQQPEYSSARIERFLQLVDDNPVEDSQKQQRKFQITNSNIQVCQPTTAANYFLLLRRQIRGDKRKPLIIMTPKRLLNFKRATSNLEDFKEGIRFHSVYPEIFQNQLLDPPKIRKVIVCSGQIYYDLLEARQSKNISDIALIRIEQLAPFPYDDFKKIINQYKYSKFMWVQEEPMNMGGWNYIEERINIILKELRIPDPVQYLGRSPYSSTASGFFNQHQLELNNILQETLQK